MPSERTDADVIAGSFADPEEFAAIFDRHFVPVHRFLARRAGPDVADELAGEVFRRAFEHRGAYDVARTECLPWLYGIARNALGHHFRGIGRQQRALQRVLLTFDDRDHGNADASFVEEAIEKVDAEALTNRAIAALVGLSEGEREALLLLTWEGLGYSEIAVALEVPVGTVRSRLHRGRRKLREHLGWPEDASSPVVEVNDD